MPMLGIIYENSDAEVRIIMEKMQEELDLFQAALGIGEPWFVSYRELDKKELLLHVGLNFKRGAEFACPD